jgi:general secretion pathway protein G
MQALLAVIGLVAAMWAWWLHAGLEWLVGGILLGAVPFTLVVIFPTNRKLLDPSLDRNSEVARRLLKKWGRLHAVRTTLSLAALLIVLAAMAAAMKRDDLMRAKEVELRQDLSTLRHVISQYTLDKQKAPQSLDDLKTAGYIHDIPKDPFTGEANWEPHREESLMAVDQQEPGIDDVHSASDLISSAGSAYSSW